MLIVFLIAGRIQSKNGKDSIQFHRIIAESFSDITMTNSTPSSDSNVYCAVVDKGKIALVKIVGRGSFQNSYPLKQFSDHVQATTKPRDFLIDLSQCPTMDSTFMGVLTCISKAQIAAGLEKVTIVNANEHCEKLLTTLGISMIININKGSSEAADRAEKKLAPAETSDVGRVDQIVHILDAHKELASLDEQNEIRFQDVIKYLEQSLKDEQSQENNS